MTHPDENSIQQRAYEIWLSEGCPEGKDEQHWHQALKELGGDAQADPDLPGSPGSASGGTESASDTRPFDGGPPEAKPRTSRATVR